ncbi:MAG TPA: ABC transporter substrate-binding protein [Methylomirabilota bacterium]
MRRRLFVGLLVVGAARAGGVAAQPAAGVHRLGILAPTEAPRAGDPHSATGSLPTHLEALGYVPGRSLFLEQRYAAGRLGDLPAMARELVRLRVEAIVAIGSSATRAAKAATSTVPIVMLGNFDPIAIGLVKSLGKPEANVTGVLIAPAGTLAGKKLELLKEAVPRATRIAFLTHEDPSLRTQEKETQAAAKALGVALPLTRLRGDDYDGAFAAIMTGRPDALFVAASTYFMRDRKRIIELAARHRLPAMYEWPEQVEDGGLMSYGGDLGQTTRRVAEYVDRIFKGARPGELPIEQPTKLHLVINLKTARRIGLSVPPSLVARADRVIE